MKARDSRAIRHLFFLLSLTNLSVRGMDKRFYRGCLGTAALAMFSVKTRELTIF